MNSRISLMDTLGNDECDDLYFKEKLEQYHRDRLNGSLQEARSKLNKYVEALGRKHSTLRRYGALPSIVLEFWRYIRELNNAIPNFPDVSTVKMPFWNLASTAYEIRSLRHRSDRRSVVQFVQSAIEGHWPRSWNSRSSIWQAERFLDAVYNLSRIVAAYLTFKQTSIYLPGFRHISIELEEPAKEKSFQWLDPLSGSSANQRLTEKTFGSAFDFFKDGTAEFKSEVIQIWNYTFSVHAEVRMMLTLESERHHGASVYSYIGCSKLSCFSCNFILKRSKCHSTHGSHGTLYAACTVPKYIDAGPHFIHRLQIALRDLGNEFQQTSSHPSQAIRGRGPESPVGLTPITPRLTCNCFMVDPELFLQFIPWPVI